ncbi:hypothetical protein CAOG_04127 [Capsaspora owczarzaki ATCC 30864]|uniref:Glycosyl transferase family 1 domain-containing protein n=1 Tax=Capsaspora owczarzaki (strain ATCC 30864) TaxID=595528 RepID=A0A0D2VR52_CAPO3|nr:hypothetical protein CAOG_04127 [Capsaspora owczarzaki ATCC 30864]KJE93322.1 hypothetical protein CAOG_004127 [Capsaspora owczarzaki ATCC 30864]|eukprot:XP_004347952.2 hypothetical protein CAOG_04127 [Capsaspora owczarzaki ATCC 30864]
MTLRFGARLAPILLVLSILSGGCSWTCLAADQPNHHRHHHAADADARLPLRIEWEGPIETSSFVQRMNVEVVSRLIARGHRVSIHPREPVDGIRETSSDAFSERTARGSSQTGAWDAALSGRGASLYHSPYTTVAEMADHATTPGSQDHHHHHHHGAHHRRAPSEDALAEQDATLLPNGEDSNQGDSPLRGAFSARKCEALRQYYYAPLLRDGHDHGASTGSPSDADDAWTPVLHVTADATGLPDFFHPPLPLAANYSAATDLVNETPYWISVLQWDFGQLPKVWPSAFASSMDEIWVPSNAVAEAFERGGVSKDLVQVVRMAGTDLCALTALSTGVPCVQGAPPRTMPNFFAKLLADIRSPRVKADPEPAARMVHRTRTQLRQERQQASRFMSDQTVHPLAKVKPFPINNGKANAFRFLWLGDPRWVKSFDLVIDVFRHTFRNHDNVTLVIAGYGDAGLKHHHSDTNHIVEKMYESIRADRHTPEIRYLPRGVVPVTMLSSVFASVDAVLLPYRMDGSGWEVTAAMEHGLPIIVTAVGAARDLCSSTRCVQVPAPQDGSFREFGRKVCIDQTFLYATADSHRHATRDAADIHSDDSGHREETETETHRHFDLMGYPVVGVPDRAALQIAMKSMYEEWLQKQSDEQGSSSSSDSSSSDSELVLNALEFAYSELSWERIVDRIESRLYTVAEKEATLRRGLSLQEWHARMHQRILSRLGTAGKFALAIGEPDAASLYLRRAVAEALPLAKAELAVLNAKALRLASRAADAVAHLRDQFPLLSRLFAPSSTQSDASASSTAEQEAEPLSETTSADVALLVEYAASLRTSGDVDVAEKLLKRALALEKCPVEAFVELAKLYREQRNDFGKATKTISDGLLCAQRDLRLLELFGHISSELGYTKGVDAAAQMIRAVDDQHALVLENQRSKAQQASDEAATRQAWAEYERRIEEFRNTWKQSHIDRPEAVAMLQGVLRPALLKDYTVFIGEVGCGKTTAVLDAIRANSTGIVYHIVQSELIVDVPKRLAGSLAFAFNRFTFTAGYFKDRGVEMEQVTSAEEPFKSWAILELGLRDVAAQFKAKHGHVATLVIDAVDLIAKKGSALLHAIQKFAKAAADEQLLNVVLVTCDVSNLPELKASSAMTRARVVEVGDLTDQQAVTYLVRRDIHEDLAKRAVAEIAGGRLILLNNLADDLLFKTVDEIFEEFRVDTADSLLRLIGRSEMSNATSSVHQTLCDLTRGALGHSLVHEMLGVDLTKQLLATKINILAYHPNKTYTLHSRHVQRSVSTLLNCTRP